MNLLDEPWIPIRRLQGDRAWISPWQIVEGHDSANPILAVDAPRPDFTGSLFQFLIGLLQTALPPKDEDEWHDRLEVPPSPEELRGLFEPHRHAFELEGDGPLFMQDLDPLAAEVPKEISALLIEAPGGKTVRDNLDLFIKRGRVPAICPACAAAALFTLQTNAPGGGVGHRTSLRGGGPLTTVVLWDERPDQELRETLWRNLWLNVLERRRFEALGNAEHNEPPAVFPWLGPTRISDKEGVATTPDDVHPLQVYWGMPRRLRLDLEQRTAGRCAICDREHEALYTRYRTKNYGTNYVGPWRHPLTPYVRGKDGEPLPQHPQPGGIGYRHWRGLVASHGEEREPAEVVKLRHDRQAAGAQLRLWASGYDMDNMKARCWYDTTMPLYHVPPERVADYDDQITFMVDAAEYAARLLRSAVKAAWFKRPADAKGDVPSAEATFWADTEADFYRAAANMAAEDADAVRDTWRRALARAAEKVFDTVVLSAPVEEGNVRRVVEARRDLLRNLGGPKMHKLLELAKPKKAVGAKKQKETVDA